RSPRGRCVPCVERCAGGLTARRPRRRACRQRCSCYTTPRHAVAADRPVWSVPGTAETGVIPPTARPLRDVLDQPQKWLLLGSLLTALFMGALDQTIVATAAPQIVADLGSFRLLPWVFTSYMLSSTVVVPLAGKLSDIFGRKPLLLAGIALFLV